MPTFNYTNSPFVTLTKIQSGVMNQYFADIKTLLNITKLDTMNIQSATLTVPAFMATSGGSVIGTGGAITFNTQAAGTFLAGPASGSSATPTFRALQAPTIQKFTVAPTGATNYAFTISSGNATIGATFTNNAQTFTVLSTVASSLVVYCSGTGTPAASGTLTKVGGSGDSTLTFSAFSGAYVTASGALYLKIRATGGGGGGCGSGTASLGSGGNGGATTFGISLISANGGIGATGGQEGGLGGTSSLGSGPIGTAASGNGGVAAGNGSGTGSAGGGAGGAGLFGGAAKGAPIATAGNAAIANSGGGGGGAGGGSTAYAGGGGGAGGFVDAIISSPSAIYSYSIGAAGAAGSTNTGGNPGGAGSIGYIEVTEHYQ